MLRLFSRKKQLFKLALLPLFLLLLSGVGEEITFYSNTPDEELAKLLIEKMTPEELIGQVLMFGYPGSRPTPDLLHWIENRHLGGVKIFGWNTDSLEQLGATIAAYQQKAAASRLQIPLLIATDQEGGWVRHVRGDTSNTPGNMAIGASGLPYDAWLIGKLIGSELRALGINMNFAPTIDLYLNPKADVIGPRAFTDDPVESALLGLAYYQGQESVGVISTAKHYPGHGGADKDSHGTLPIIKIELETLLKEEVFPYKVLISERVPALMVGHLGYPNIIGSYKPASFSSYFCTDLLRGYLQFEGVLITDDLAMYGAQYNNLSVAESARLSVEAGSDIILMSTPVEAHNQIGDLFLDTYRRDPAFSARIRESAERVILMKLRYLKGEGRVPLYPASEEISNKIPYSQSGEVLRNQAARAVSPIRWERGTPVSEDEKILLVTPYALSASAARERYPEAHIRYYPLYASQKQILAMVEEVSAIADQYDTIIFCISNEMGLFFLQQLEIFKKKIVVLSALTPIYLLEIIWLENAIAVYGIGTESFRAGFAVLRGDYIPSGRVPLQAFKE